jgi:hypothetical protein
MSDSPRSHPPEKCNISIIPGHTKADKCKIHAVILPDNIRVKICSVAHTCSDRNSDNVRTKEQNKGVQSGSQANTIYLCIY